MKQPIGDDTLAGYVRQSSADIVPTATVRAAPINAEYNKLSDAFAISTGHKHDGSTGEGGYIPLIGDVDALNKVSINTNNNTVSVFLEVSSSAVEQVRFKDGVILPVTTNDIDLGSSSNKFKDLYLQGTATLANVDINAGSIDGTTIGSSTPAVATFTNATLNNNLVVTGTSTLLGTTSITSVDLNSGVIDNAVIGNSTPTSGTFTNLTANTSLVAATADINGGSIDGATIGASTPSTGSFTTLSASGASTLATVDINGGNIDGTVIGSSVTAAGSFTTLSTSGQATLATADINGGSIDGSTIGASSASTGAFTTLTASGGITGDVTGDVTGNVTGNVTGSITGNVTGNLTGNVTSSGSSSFNNVTIDGTLNMNAGTTATIQNLTAPTNDLDAATKKYADDLAALKLNLSGGTLSGALNVGSNKVTATYTPSASTDLTTKAYVDSEISTLIGDAGTGLDTLGELADALNDDDDFSTTVTNLIATKLPLAGGTLTGDLVMGSNSVTSTANPATNDELSRKGYVDAQDATKLAKAGGTMTGAIAMSTNKITGAGNPTASQDVSTKAYTDTQRDTRVSKLGDTMSGALAMGNNKITGLGTPTANADASSKQYVDGLFQSTVAAATSATNAATSATNSASSATASANSASAASISAANAAASYDQFDDRYLGAKSSAPSVDNDGDALIVGALFFNTATSVMMVYATGGWQAAGSPVNGTAERFTYTATAGQTVFAATYDAGFIDLYLNGSKQLVGTDFTATNGTSVTLASGAAVNDIIDIVAYGTFTLSNHYTKSEADNRYLLPSLGTAGQVLTVNSGANATEWATAGGGGALELISTNTFTSSASSLEFTNISGYTHYRVVFALNTSGAGVLYIRVGINGTYDTGSNYNLAGSSQDKVQMFGGFSGKAYCGETHITHLNQTLSTKIYSSGIMESNDATSTNNYETGGGHRTTTAQNSIQIFGSSGNISSGIISLYGVKV